MFKYDPNDYRFVLKFVFSCMHPMPPELKCEYSKEFGTKEEIRSAEENLKNFRGVIKSRKNSLIAKLEKSPRRVKQLQERINFPDYPIILTVSRN